MQGVNDAAQLAVQAAGAVVLLVNSGLLLKITYAAGQLVQRVEEHDRRLEVLETAPGRAVGAHHGR